MGKEISLKEITTVIHYVHRTDILRFVHDRQMTVPPEVGCKVEFKCNGT